MKKLSAFIFLLGIILLIQILTFYLISDKRLPNKVLSSIPIDYRFKQDSVILNPILSHCGNTEPRSSIYLDLYNKNNFTAIEKKFPNAKIIKTEDYAKYCSEIAQEQFKRMTEKDWINFTTKLWDKVELNIYALRNNFFKVTINIELHRKTLLLYSSNKTYFWLYLWWIEL